MIGTNTNCNGDLCIHAYCWKEAILADPVLLEVSSDASPDTLQPGLCLLFDFVVNHFPRSIASLMHDSDDSLINVDGKAGTEKKAHIIYHFPRPKHGFPRTLATQIQL